MWVSVSSSRCIIIPFIFDTLKSKYMRFPTWAKRMIAEFGSSNTIRTLLGNKSVKLYVFLRLRQQR